MKLLQSLWRQRLLVLLMILAAALRLWYLRINPLWPQFSNADDGDYFQRALRLAVTGAYVDDAWLIRPPFHVWVFAAWLKLALLLGQPPAFGVRLIQLFQIALGTLMVPLCYALAARLFNRRAGLIFALFWAIWFSFVDLPVTLFSEPIYLFLFTLHLWLLLRFEDTGRARGLALAGLVLGLAALTRSPALYALVFAVPWLLWRAVESRRRADGSQASGAAHPSVARFVARPSPATSGLRFILHPLKRVPASSLILPFTVLAACTLAVVLPWTLRNWIVYQRVIPIDTLGPINLWLDLESAGQRAAKIELLRSLPQADRQAYATDRVREILSVDPLRPFRSVWPTFRHIWKAQYVEDLWVKQSFFTRPLREAAPLGLLGDAIWLVISLAGIVGLLHPATDRPFKLLIGLWLSYSFATVLIFHVEPRYLLPIWLLLGLYAAGLLGTGLDRARLRAHPLRSGLLLSAAAGLLLLIVSYRDYPALISRGTQREQHMRCGDLAYRRDDFVTAEREYRAALSVDPGFVDGEVALALALGGQHKPQQGLAALKPEDSRRSRLVAGLLSRAAGDLPRARELLGPIERLAGEDVQRWAIEQLPVEPRDALVLGDGALDLGYISGFADSEQSGERSYRWLLGDGEIVLPLSEPLRPGATITIELAAPLDLGGPLQLRLADSPALALSPEPEWRSYRLAVPPALVGQRELRLQLHAPTRLPMRDDPASNDPRALSVMVHQVALEW